VWTEPIPSLSIVHLIKYHNLSVTDHSLTITKPDGKTTSSQVGKTAAPAVVAAKVKEAKRDAVDRETLQIVESQLDHATKGFDAVSVLFQYLINDVSTKRFCYLLRSSTSLIIPVYIISLVTTYTIVVNGYRL